MKFHYFVSCTLATGSAVIFPDLRTPKVSEIRGAQIMRVTQLTYNASVVSGESVLIEKWRSMVFSMPIDGQTFTADQYLDAATNIVSFVADLRGLSGQDIHAM